MSVINNTLLSMLHDCLNVSRALNFFVKHCEDAYFITHDLYDKLSIIIKFNKYIASTVTVPYYCFIKVLQKLTLLSV